MKNLKVSNGGKKKVVSGFANVTYKERTRYFSPNQKTEEENSCRHANEYVLQLCLEKGKNRRFTVGVSKKTPQNTVIVVNPWDRLSLWILLWSPFL